MSVLLLYLGRYLYSQSVCPADQQLLLQYAVLGNRISRSSRQLLQVDLEINLPRVPLLQGVQELLERGVQSTATEGNSHSLQFVSNRAQLTKEHVAVLLDPQTSGAILLLTLYAKCEKLCHGSSTCCTASDAFP